MIVAVLFQQDLIFPFTPDGKTDCDVRPLQWIMGRGTYSILNILS